jgi:hypothetical protein
MYVYCPSQGEDWMSTGLQLVNSGWIAFDVGTCVLIYVPYYWDVRQVDLVLTNSIYNPMSAHRRYTIAWQNGGGGDGLGHVCIYQQSGTDVDTLTCTGVYPQSPHRAIAFCMERVGANTVYFCVGQDVGGSWSWGWKCEASYIFSDNYPDYIFDTYGNTQYSNRQAYFDNFYVLDNWDFLGSPPFQ